MTSFIRSLRQKTAMVILFLGIGLAFWSNANSAEIITGAGATFPYPIYSKWAHSYAKETGIKLNYQSIGSGGGIRQIKARAVDFGASDAPLNANELNEAGLLQFPMVIGGVVPVVNIKGIGSNVLKLDGETLALIFLGAIKYWDDPRIKQLNQGIKLPHLKIYVVHRSDGSGTTWIFSKYLSSMSPKWQEKVGVGKALKWPTGVGGKGNEGVAAYVKRLKGSIGYVEFAYAKQNNLTSVLLKNKDGNFVSPTIDSFQAAAKNADWINTPGMAVVLVNQPGKNSWPITGASFILIYKEQKDKNRAITMLKFFDWCYKNGTEMARDLLYVPMPLKVVQIVEQMWAKEITVNGEPIWPSH
ncbi:Phosphate ABC transporter, periplasmic phosphate-binding protein PstS [Dissulfuribacter thermophilus]|uniref:Phosphate-binding protein n=1 Tax=Dissulfuribacter thermophilus TaxID=1156395 RepID=A0A1B9F5K2_9BACT|nr:phosphate ABC transporter substrate-binding protein PstS [Dissulfuribacter thermophilus]OCC15196.1 Phosphate ABC transporter, periplasmic phosphate-binding protein PstS [Dissulfuribacter thermophilus]